MKTPAELMAHWRQQADEIEPDLPDDEPWDNAQQSEDAAIADTYRECAAALDRATSPGPDPQPEPRSYCIGIPLAVTVHADGRVEFDVDLSEVSDIDEDDDAYGRYGVKVAVDRLTVSEAASKVGNHFNFTIHNNA